MGSIFGRDRLPAIDRDWVWRLSRAAGYEVLIELFDEASAADPKTGFELLNLLSYIFGSGTHGELPEAAMEWAEEQLKRVGPPSDEVVGRAHAFVQRTHLLLQTHECTLAIERSLRRGRERLGVSTRASGELFDVPHSDDEPSDEEMPSMGPTRTGAPSQLRT